MELSCEPSYGVRRLELQKKPRRENMGRIKHETQFDLRRYADSCKSRLGALRGSNRIGTHTPPGAPTEQPRQRTASPRRGISESILCFCDTWKLPFACKFVVIGRGEARFACRSGWACRESTPKKELHTNLLLRDRKRAMRKLARVRIQEWFAFFLRHEIGSRSTEIFV
jgi:hypothetical protein